MCRRGLFLLAGALLLLPAGCGKKLVKASGVVLLNNRPLPNAVVTFHPIDGQGTPASALTDSQGAFELTTRNDNDGAYPGDYRVTVAVNDPTALVDLESAMAGVETPVRGKSTIHTNYLNPGTTPLAQVVPAAGSIKLMLNREGK